MDRCYDGTEATEDMDRESFEHRLRELRDQYPTGVPEGRISRRPPTQTDYRRAYELIYQYGLWHLLKTDEEPKKDE